MEVKEISIKTATETGFWTGTHAIVARGESVNRALATLETLTLTVEGGALVMRGSNGHEQVMIVVPGLSAEKLDDQVRKPLEMATEDTGLVSVVRRIPASPALPKSRWETKLVEESFELQVITGRGYGTKFSGVKIIIPDDVERLSDISFLVQRFGNHVDTAAQKDGEPVKCDSAEAVIRYAYDIRADEKLSATEKGALGFLNATVAQAVIMLFPEFSSRETERGKVIVRRIPKSPDLPTSREEAEKVVVEDKEYFVANTILGIGEGRRYSEVEIFVPTNTDGNATDAMYRVQRMELKSFVWTRDGSAVVAECADDAARTAYGLVESKDLNQAAQGAMKYLWGVTCQFANNMAGGKRAGKNHHERRPLDNRPDSGGALADFFGNNPTVYADRDNEGDFGRSIGRALLADGK